MVISIDEDNLKQGLLGLIVALVEIIKEALERQALKRIESGKLSADEEARLSEALADLDEALEHIKKENNIEDVVQSVNDGLTEVADIFLNPERWERELKKA
jgi:formylmethanofuran:tetrahydromethanopterin formyltransferase